MISDANDGFETKSRSLFDASVQRLDMRARARLNQARHVALDTATCMRGRRWMLPLSAWMPAAGVAAAALLGTALWFGVPPDHPASGGDQAGLEDLDIFAASDTGAGDAMEMLQDDIDFYDFADKISNSEPAA